MATVRFIPSARWGSDHGAIEAVRRTIEELRLARRGVSSVTALGFVMATPRSRRQGRTAGELAVCKSAGCSSV